MRYNAPVVVLSANEVCRVLYNEGCVCVCVCVYVDICILGTYIHTQMVTGVNSWSLVSFLRITAHHSTWAVIVCTSDQSNSIVDHTTIKP